LRQVLNGIADTAVSPRCWKEKANVEQSNSDDTESLRKRSSFRCGLHATIELSFQCRDRSGANRNPRHPDAGWSGTRVE
jgi:hypothetical protein